MKQYCVKTVVSTGVMAATSAVVLAMLAGGVMPAFGQGKVTPSEPVLVPAPVYPEGMAVPKGATAAEKAYMATLVREDGTLPVEVPTGTVVCPGEYAPADGLIFAWEPTSAGLTTILTEMVRRTTTQGNANAYISFDTTAERDSVLPTLIAAGANMSRVVSLVRTTDAIWMRDYGPRYIYEGDVRAIVDHPYNVTSRVNDNSFPTFFAPFKKHRLYSLPLVHGGGNFHLSSDGRAFASRLLTYENPGFTEAGVLSTYAAFQGVNLKLWDPLPEFVDGTQHIDMWMQIIGDNSVILSDWPNDVGSTQDRVCDYVAAVLAADGWTVTRVPARFVGNVHYTYTNMVMVNDLVMMPSYANATVAPSNAPALAAVQAALPGKTVVQIPSDALAQLAGVMHCIVMHVPVNKNGENPGALVRSPAGGEVLTSASPVTITWSTDDDVSVSNVDILLSTDGGATFPTTIASAVADTGSFVWNVPTGVSTTSAKIRVVARDGGGRTGQDDSDRVFSLNAPAARFASASVTVSDAGGTGNGNGIADPGETQVKLSVLTTNAGNAAASGVVGTLTSLTPTATVTATSAVFGDAAPGGASSNVLPFVLRISPAHVCGEPVKLRLSIAGTGVAPEQSVELEIATGTAPGLGAAQTFTFNGTLAIPDANAVGTTATINVSGFAPGQVIGDVDARILGTTCSATAGATTVGLTHSFVSDLIVTLTPPAPALMPVQLLNMPGGANFNGGNNFCNTIFDDGASNNIQNIAASGNPWSGSFRPMGNMATLNGLSPNGAWTVRLVDLLAQDTGTLRSMSLVIRPRIPASCAQPGSGCQADIANTDGEPGADGVVDNGDFTLFFAAFFDSQSSNALMADIGNTDAEPLPDGVVDNGDFTLFFSSFFGCN